MSDTDSRDDDEIRANAEQLEIQVADRHVDAWGCDDLCNAACRAYDDIRALLARATAAEERIEAVRALCTADPHECSRACELWGCDGKDTEYFVMVEHVLAALGPSTAPGADG